MKKSLTINWIFSIALAVLIGLTLDNNPFSNITAGTDSSVFITIGKGIASGNLPYIDYFDHKGPLLYLFNFIGWFFGGFFGVFLIEVIAIAVCAFFAVKTARLLFCDIASYIGTVLGFLCLGVLLQGGNLAELYALPFIFIAFYIFSKYLKTSKLVLMEIAITGGCFAATLLLRPNMFGLFFAFCLVIFVDLVIKKEYVSLYKCVKMFLIGFAVFLLPTSVYLVLTNSTAAFIEQFLLFNMSYASDGFGVERMVLNVNQLNEYIPVVLLLSVSLCFFITDKTNKKIFLSVFVGFLVSLFLVLYSRAYYPHYSIVLLPFIVFVCVCVLDFGITKCKGYRIVAITLVGLLLYSSFFEAYKGFFETVVYKNLTATSEQKSSIMSAAEYIEQNSNPHDTIISIGNRCEIYPYVDRDIASKYLYQDPIINISNEIASEFKQDIINNQPKFIIFSFHFPFEQYGTTDSPLYFLIDILNSEYNLSYNENGISIYERV